MEVVSRKEAKALGLKFYFSGQECFRGHLAKRDTRGSTCVECNKVTCKARYGRLTTAQRQKEKKRLAAYYRKNRRHCQRLAREYIEHNRERVAEVKRLWQVNNKEKYFLDQLRWRKRNKKWMLAYRAKWRKENVELRTANENRRRAIKKAAGGRGITAQDIKNMIANQNRKCAYCKKRRKLTLDHVIPLSKGGIHDVKNAAMACRPCNSGKHDMPVKRFLARLAA